MIELTNLQDLLVKKLMDCIFQAKYNNDFIIKILNNFLFIKNYHCIIINNKGYHRSRRFTLCIM